MVRLFARIIDSVASMVLFKLIDVVRCRRCLGDRNEPTIAIKFSVIFFLEFEQLRFKRSKRSSLINLMKCLPEFDRDLIDDAGTVVGEAGQKRSESV